MKILYDYRCENCGMQIEEMTSMSTKTIPCGCGENMSRMISPVRSRLEGVSGDFPSAAMAWDKKHIRGARED